MLKYLCVFLNFTSYKAKLAVACRILSETAPWETSVNICRFFFAPVAKGIIQPHGPNKLCNHFLNEYALLFQQSEADLPKAKFFF